MATILIVDADQCRHDRFRKIFQDNPEVKGDSEIVSAGGGGLVQYRWVANDVVPHRVLSAYSYSEAVAMLSTMSFDLVCLDHDMGPAKEGADGRGLAKWMSKRTVRARFSQGRWNPRFAQRVLIHSLNPIAAAEMAAPLREHPGFDVKVLPYKPEPGERHASRG